MVDIQSKEVIDKISDELKIQPSMQIPRELAKQIQLSYNINPTKKIRISSNSASDSAAATILTTNSTRKTFMIGLSISIAKDVLSPSTLSSIQGQLIGGAANASIMIIRYEPLTAGQFSENIIFSEPVELEKNSIVRVTNTSATPSIDATGIIYFFETDPQ